MHSPLSLNFLCGFVLSYTLFEAKDPEDILSKLPLDFGSSPIHPNLQFSMLNQSVQVKDIHIHHSLVRNIVNLWIIILQVFDNLPSHRDFVCQTSELFEVVVDSYKRKLLFELVSRG